MRNLKWMVILKDGTEIVEDGTRGFGSLPQDEILDLIVFDEHDHSTVYSLHLSDDMRPIFFRRKRHLIITDESAIPTYYFDGNENLQTTILFATVLGWQKTVNGKNVKSMTWIFADGSVAITDCDIDDI